MSSNTSTGLQRQRYARRKNNDKLSCIGCSFNPTMEELKKGLICKSDDQSCEGKLPAPRGVLKTDKVPDPASYSIL